MNFIVLFGPPAVGKMTVGQELAKLTGYKLLHNHMTIDLVTEFFDFGTPQFGRLVPEFRRMIVREAAASDLPGMIFTFVWGLDLPEDKTFIDDLCGYVEDNGGTCYFAELAAPVDERLRRNLTENRLKHKKKDRAVSEAYILGLENASCPVNSNGDFPYPDRHIKIDNTNLSAEEAARRIKDHFKL
jgi:hypothetical protein